MCGILGIYGQIDIAKAKKAFKALHQRGKDDIGAIVESQRAIFHCLHNIVGNVKQPLVKGSSIFVANCEIYNWKELNAKYNFAAKNDADTLFCLLEKFGVDAIDEVDGVYAFAWEKNAVLVLARDVIGVKPLCYVWKNNFFAFASEGKALVEYGDIKHLLPTELLFYNVKNNQLIKEKRKFFEINEQYEPISNKMQQNNSHIIITKHLERNLITAVEKRVAGLSHFGILFSGGIDSTIVAFICKKLGKKFTCYTAAFADGNTCMAPDIIAAKEVANKLGFLLNYRVIGLQETEKMVKDVIAVIETQNPVKVGVALPFFISAQMAAADGCKVLFSGLGSEELFAGYKRHLDVLLSGGDVNKECLHGLSLMWDRDLYRDDLVTMAHTVELRLPFLDHDLVRFSLKIPAVMKLTHEQNKLILRKTAIEMGIPDLIAMQKKRAAQYGSNFDRALEKLAKKKRVNKAEYLRTL